MVPDEGHNQPSVTAHMSAVLGEPSLTFYVAKEFMGLYRKFTHITLGPLETLGHVKWSNRVKPIILPR